MFFTRTTATLTFLDETFTALLKPTLLTGIQHLLLQWLYLTLRALLRPSHRSYSPTTFVTPTNLQLPYDIYWLTLKTGTNLRTDKEQFTRSNAATIRLPTLARLAESFKCDWLNTNELWEMVMQTITLLYIIKWQTITLTGTLLSA